MRKITARGTLSFGALTISGIELQPWQVQVIKAALASPEPLRLVPSRRRRVFQSPPPPPPPSITRL